MVNRESNRFDSLFTIYDSRKATSERTEKFFRQVCNEGHETASRLSATKIIFEPYDVVFTEIISTLYFNEDQWAITRILDSVC